MTKASKNLSGPVSEPDDKGKASPSSKPTDGFSHRIETDEAHAQALEASARRIDAVATELRDRNLMRSRRALARLDRSGPPLKHGLRQLADDSRRRHLLRALRSERDIAIERILKSGSVAWDSPLRRKDDLGAGLDERVVEIPLAVECASPEVSGRVLDAGCALNLLPLRNRLASEATFVHFTQSGDAEHPEFDDSRFSYLFGDLRELPFRDNWFDRVLCISTLEHVGMDNERYGGPSEQSPETWRQAVDELVRVLSGKGTLMISVPCGRPRNLGWYRVFSREEVIEVEKALAPLDVETRYFAYDGGWFDAKPKQMAELDDEESVIRGVAVVRAQGIA